MIKDNWIPVSDIIITQEINSIHCDTRDFCCSLSKDDIKKQYPDEELSKLFGLLFNRPKSFSWKDKYLIKEEDIKSFLEKIKNFSNPNANWRCLVFKDVNCEGWLKYIRMYRYSENEFIVCNRSSIPIEYKNCTEENLNKEYLCDIEE